MISPGLQTSQTMDLLHKLVGKSPWRFSLHTCRVSSSLVLNWQDCQGYKVPTRMLGYYLWTLQCQNHAGDFSRFWIIEERASWKLQTVLREASPTLQTPPCSKRGKIWAPDKYNQWFNDNLSDESWTSQGSWLLGNSEVKGITIEEEDEVEILIKMNYFVRAAFQ